MTAAAIITRRLLIEGRVQRVGFRWSFKEQMRQLKLDGWVRNRSDGSVEAQISGPLEAVDILTAWAHHGPPWARVDCVHECEPILPASFPEGRR